MAYSTRAQDYDEKLLREIAHRYFLNKESQDSIADNLNINRSKVVAICRAAEISGVVRLALVPSATSSPEILARLAARVRERYDLKDCILVGSDNELIDADIKNVQVANRANLRYIILNDLAREASKEVSRRFAGHESPILTVSYGFMTRLIADALAVSENLDHQGVVIPGHGIPAMFMDRFDANDIARDIARYFGCSYMCLPIPGVIRPSIVNNKVLRICGKEIPHNIINNVALFFRLGELFPDYKRIIRTISKSNLVLTGMGAMEYVENPNIRGDIDNVPGLEESKAESQKHNLFWLNSRDIRSLGNERRVVANYCGWWIDDNGDPVERPDNMLTVGIPISKLRKMVSSSRDPREKNKPSSIVILAAGCDPMRIPGIHTVLDRGLANVWVGDEATAHVLLGNRRVGEAYYDRMYPAQKSIIDSLKKPV